MSQKVKPIIPKKINILIVPINNQCEATQFAVIEIKLIKKSIFNVSYNKLKILRMSVD
jgi:hypothetical protein